MGERVHAIHTEGRQLADQIQELEADIRGLEAQKRQLEYKQEDIYHINKAQRESRRKWHEADQAGTKSFNAQYGSLMHILHYYSTGKRQLNRLSDVLNNSDINNINIDNNTYNNN